jgi:hypothetical protein
MGLTGESIQNVNTFLTNFATSYKLPNPAADFVAPPFKVALEAGKYISYTKSIMRVFDDKVIGRQIANEIQWDVAENTYACEEYSMEKFVSDKAKQQSVKPINLDLDATKMLKRMHAASREYRISQIAANAAVVTQTLAVGAAWAGAAGTPIANIATGMAQITTATGGYIANKILIPVEVALNMIQTTEWKDQFKYTDSGFKGGLWNAISGLRQMGLEPMIANSYGVNTEKCSASDPEIEAMWSDSVVLLYSEPSPTLESRTFMYSPFVWQNLMMTNRAPRERGVYHTIYSDIDELLVDAQCAYLFTNCI